MFLGTLVIKDKPPVKAELKRTPSNTRIRLKLMPVLLNSREAAVQFPSCIQVTFDLLFGTSGNSNAKLKMMAVQFVHQIIYHCPEQRLSPIGMCDLGLLLVNCHFCCYFIGQKHLRDKVKKKCKIKGFC